MLQNFERGFLYYQLDDLPVNQLHVDDLAQEVETMAKRFDEAPEEFAVPEELVQAAKAKVKDARKGGRGMDRSSGRVRPPAEIKGPLTGKYSTKALTPLIEESLSALERTTPFARPSTRCLASTLARVTSCARARCRCSRVSSSGVSRPAVCRVRLTSVRRSCRSSASLSASVAAELLVEVASVDVAEAAVVPVHLDVAVLPRTRAAVMVATSVMPDQ